MPKKKNKHKHKTMSILLDLDKDTKKVLDFMTGISKNIANSTLFCTKIFYRYIKEIYAELIAAVNNEHLVGVENENEEQYDISNEQVNSRLMELFIQIYDKYYKHYCEIKQQLFDNTRRIYKKANKIFGYNSKSYDEMKLIRPIINSTYAECNMLLQCHTVDILFECTPENRKELYDDIIEDYMRKAYNKNYCSIQYQIKNKIPCTLKIKNITFPLGHETIEKFIAQVKNKEYLLQPLQYKKYKNLIRNQYHLQLTSDKNIIARFVLKHLSEDDGKLPTDLVIQIIAKIQTAYTSYFEIRKKGKPCKEPNYLSSMDKFVVQFYARSFLIKDKHIRLAVGKYIGQNYSTIIGDIELLPLVKKQDPQHQKYADILKFKSITDDIDKKKCYICGNQYISKDSEHIIDASYLFFDLPDKLNDKTIKLMEIVPLYEGYKYKLNIVYLRQKAAVVTTNSATLVEEHKDNTDITKNYISIDLGMRNIMTIYDPNGLQYIIRGGYIKALNHYFNDKIDKKKSTIKKCNNLDTCKKIRDLLMKRSYKIDYYFDMIVKWILTTYSDKKLIIVGKNIGWKNGCHMGRMNNRDFYSIPYNKLINKLEDQCFDKGIKLVITEESYTSMCDALSLDPVRKHGTDKKRRVKRGLYSSSKHKYINADLNGAINIARKYFGKQKTPIKKILGQQLFNPRTAYII